jgi:hypothetical protein
MCFILRLGCGEPRIRLSPIQSAFRFSSHCKWNIDPTKIDEKFVRLAFWQRENSEVKAARLMGSIGVAIP